MSKSQTPTPEKILAKSVGSDEQNETKNTKTNIVTLENCEIINSVTRKYKFFIDFENEIVHLYQGEKDLCILDDPNAIVSFVVSVPLYDFNNISQLYYKRRKVKLAIADYNFELKSLSRNK